MLRRLSLVLLVVISGPFAPAHGQAPSVAPTQQQPLFRSAVDLVPVNVVVVDAQGRHIHGLTKSDFQLFDSGDQQPVATFEEVSFDGELDSAREPSLPARMHRDVASNRAVADQRLVVVVIDDLHIYRARADRARDIATQIVERLGVDTFMSVLFTSGEHSTEVTNDTSRLLAAVETTRGWKAWRRPHAAIDSQTPPPPPRSGNPDALLRHVDRIQATRLQEFFDNMSLYKTLESAARALHSSKAPRKTFVMVSEGVGLDATGLFDVGEPPCGGACYHLSALRNMMASLHRSNVATYILDPRGQVSSEELLQENFPAPPGFGVPPTESQFRWNNPVRKAQRGLREVAEVSGGFAVTDSDELESGIDRIAEDLNHYYLLGFYPKQSTKGGYRRLEVRTVKGGVTVRHRRGYDIERPNRSRTVGPLERLIEGVLPEGDLPLRLQAFRTTFGRDETWVGIALEVTAPASSLPGTNDGLVDDVRYALYAIDVKKGRTHSQHTGGARLRLRPSRPDTDRSTGNAVYQILTSLVLPPGTYQLRVSVLSDRLRTGGSVFLDLPIAKHDVDRPQVSDLVVSYADGPRVAIAHDQRLADQGINLLPAVPTLDRVFRPGERLRAVLGVRSRGGLSYGCWFLFDRRMGERSGSLRLSHKVATESSTCLYHWRVLLQAPTSSM